MCKLAVWNSLWPITTLPFHRTNPPNVARMIRYGTSEVITDPKLFNATEQREAAVLT